MKNSIKALCRAVVLAAAAAAFVRAAFAIADIALLGKGADWFEETFFTDMGYAYWANGGKVHVRLLKWEPLKEWFCHVGMALGMIWAVTVAIAYTLGGKSSEKKTVRSLGRMLRQYFSQEIGASPFPKAYEEVADYAAVLKNQIKNNEDMLLAESGRKNDLIAYLAHDLKTPLTSVIGYLSLLKEAPDMPPEQRAKYTGIALEKALRLESLINEFFDITRYNIHEIVLEEETFDLGYLLMQMAEEFYPVLERQGKSIHVQAEEDLTITADPAKLARVFNNILKNAMAYSCGNTQIEIRARRLENVIRVTVSNRGKTIPKQKLDVIFEKFYRLDGARSTNTGGAGLGLAIAREIVTAHGGRISAASENQVTAFTVELPLHRT